MAESPLEKALARKFGTLPGWFGVEFDRLEPGLVTAGMQVRPEMLAPNGYLHAASLVALADTCAGYGTLASLPSGADSFTTMELKSNFLGTVTAGQLLCEARLAHGGRRTQVWDATITAEANARTLALFRCTQLLLYPQSPG